MISKIFTNVHDIQICVGEIFSLRKHVKRQVIQLQILAFLYDIHYVTLPI